MSDVNMAVICQEEGCCKDVFLCTAAVREKIILFSRQRRPAAGSFADVITHSEKSKWKVRLNANV